MQENILNFLLKEKIITLGNKIYSLNIRLRLKKARLVSQEKRSAKAKEKKLKKLKEVEADLENNMVEKITKKAKEKLVEKKETNTEDMEKKIEERLRKKLENEYSHKYKDDTINSLKEQLNQAEKKEVSLAKNLTSKYGKGSIDLETGTFIPSNENK